MSEHLRKDEDLRLAYEANVAMLLHDRYGITDFETRNRAALDVLNLLFDNVGETPVAISMTQHRVSQEDPVTASGPGERRMFHGRRRLLEKENVMDQFLYDKKTTRTDTYTAKISWGPGSTRPPGVVDNKVVVTFEDGHFSEVDLPFSGTGRERSFLRVTAMVEEWVEEIEEKHREDLEDRGNPKNATCRVERSFLFDKEAVTCLNCVCNYPSPSDVPPGTCGRFCQKSKCPVHTDDIDKCARIASQCASWMPGRISRKEAQPADATGGKKEGEADKCST